MKRLYAIFLVVILLPFCVEGQQNHVPNGNFEYYTTCPTSSSQMSLCTGWSSWNPLSPDYYNACFTGTNGPGVPSSFAGGYQPAASGNGYAGGYSFVSNQKEVITRPIIPLQVGVTYEVSLSVSRANWSPMATNDVGVFFYDNSPTFYNTSGIPTIGTGLATAQVIWPNTIITDTQNWVRLTQVYTADSAYDNIAIGGFLPQNSMSYIQYVGTTPSSAYYLFDSVVVKVFDSLSFSFTDTVKCSGDTIQINYSSKKKQSNNVYTIQLSNASGSFNTPINIGSKSADTSGTITAVIPANTSTGTGYKIRLLASNYADTSATTVNLRIGNGPINKPVAGNNGPLCANDTLKLTASSTTTGVSYSWTGVNSFTSTLQNPTIPNPVPAQGGSYIVTTKLYGCVARDTTTVVVNPGTGPSGTTATSNTPICADDTLKLFGTANGSSNTYSWTGPNSFTSNQQNPILPIATAAASGDYVLYASDGNCVSKDTTTIIVKPRPSNFTSTSNSPLCSGTTLNFTASSASTGVTYAWSGPNGFNSTVATPFINGASSVNAGDYYVTGTLSGCSLTDTLPITIKQLPTKPVANSNTPLCAGDTLQLTVGTSSSASYGWTGPLSFTSSSQNPIVSNTTAGMSGNYIITLDSNGCTRKDTATVLVKPLPASVATTNNTPICAGDTLKVFSTASSTGVTYAWSGPLSYSSSIQNSNIPNSTAAMTGWYKMIVTLSGCTVTDSTYATINAIPATPSITFSNPICVGEMLNLNASTVSGVTYSWTGANNFSSNLQNPNRTNMQFGDTGTYKVTATANGCTSPADSVKVNLNPNPFVVIFANTGDTICQDDPVLFTALPNNHGSSPTYLWKVNGQSAGTGIVFNTASLNDGDVVNCEMTEYTKCLVAFKDESNDINMKVLPWLAPSVTITANPNTPLDQYEYVTFTAVTTNAGSNPKYQWKRNGQIQQGVTGNVWSANTLNDNDSVSVEIVSDYKCPRPTSSISNWIRIRTTGVSNITGLGDLVLYPNPNKGKFILKAPLYLSPRGRGLVEIQVLNTLGQVVYSDNTATVNGALHKEIDLGNIAGGVYLLRVKSDDGKMASMRFRVD